MNDHVCRRIFLFLDGTWNEDEEDRPATNIVYLRERLFWGLNRRLRHCVESQQLGKPNDDAVAFDKLPDSIKKKGLSGLIFDGFEYIAYYDRGVGTGPYLDAIKGGAFGEGIDQNIREAYRFLSSWFRPGDEIFVFGFSRGSFTARSLCGYLQAVGLLRSEQCTPDNEERAWRYYRTPPGDRLSGEWAWFQTPQPGATQAPVHDERFMRVRVLGVFETVGALGIPENVFRKINQLKYGFHDTEVNSLVDIRLHALALDEPRYAFGPTLWTKPKFKLADHDKSPTEQVWFAGAHSDVGGGYVNWAIPKTHGLSTLPLAWLLQRVRHLVPATPPIADPMPSKPVVEPNRKAAVEFFDTDLLEKDGTINPDLHQYSLADQHTPWAPLYTVIKPNRRVVNQMVSPNKPAIESTGRVPFADPICEFIHVSTLQRFNNEVKIDKGRLLNRLASLLCLSKRYRPRNLIDVLPYVAATYVRNMRVPTEWCNFVKPILTWKEMRIVDWDGRHLVPSSDADAIRAFALLPKPGDIGITKMPEAMEPILDPRLTHDPQKAYYWPSPS